MGEEQAPGATDAAYKITISLNFQNPNFTIPPGAHVTSVAGMIHSQDTSLWSLKNVATIGLENVAETGNTVAMSIELDSIILRGKALSRFVLMPPPLVGSTTFIEKFNSNFSCFSFASMLAPSPDWFMGVSSVNLYKEHQWVNELMMPILLFDAGTEDGDVFGYDNPATVPQMPISLLTPVNASVLANGNNVMIPIGTIHFVKIN
ncbi:MAG: spondin domain-containing protein [Ferruginibacter sp.]